MASPLDRFRPVLAIAAIVAFTLVVGGVVWSAALANTFGFDFLAYHQAATRILDGLPLYDTSVTVTGGFGLFYYPPTFAVAVLPLALVPGPTAAWIWFAASVAMLVGAIWIAPVSSSVRWLVLLLAALDWPVAYAFKLGQVGPLLLLLFAAGWQWLDRPVVLGAVGALGAAVKVQPGLIVVWALLTRRRRAVGAAVAIGIVVAVVATAATRSVGVWFDFLALLRQVSNPITTPHNFTPGAVAYQAGLAEATANLIQLASTALVAIGVVWSALRLPAIWSYLVTVVASQLVSPVLWDHYAMLLLLPVAALLDRRHWWAALIPLATSVLLLSVGLPPVVYPAAFWVTLIALLVAGARERARERTIARPA